MELIIFFQKYSNTPLRYNNFPLSHMFENGKNNPRSVEVWSVEYLIGVALGKRQACKKGQLWAGRGGDEMALGIGSHWCCCVRH